MFGVNVSAGGLPEVCWRSVRGGYRARRFEVNVSAGGLPEVCWRSVRGGYRARRFEVNVSAGGLPEVCQVRGTEDHQLLLPTQEEKYYSHTVG